MSIVEEKKIWKLENIINILNHISLELSITAAEAKQLGRSFGAVSMEIKKFIMIFERDVFGKVKFENYGFEEIEDKMKELGSMLRILGTNTLLEARRVNNSKAYILCDEIRKIGESIQNILEMPKHKKNLNMIDPDKSFKEPFPYFVMKIGGAYWVENMNSIIEVIPATKKILADYPLGSGKMKHQILIKGIKMPVLNLQSEMGREIEIGNESRIVILNLGHILYGHSSSELFFGLLVDEIEYCGFLQKGIQELDIPEGMPENYIRYCWNTKDTSLMFFNWDNIINEHEIRDYKKLQ